MDNLINLPVFDAKTVVENLRARYNKDQIYTCISTILLAVCPFKTLPLYSFPTLSVFSSALSLSHLAASPPHVFKTAALAYQAFKEDGINQSIVISGESGTGKTESAKFVLQYLTMAAGGNTNIQYSINASSPLLEALGNAKTVCNDNSSRFGKWINIAFDNQNMCIAGGKIDIYLLEKTRVVHQGKDERNYHIFYQLLEGLEDSAKAQLGLTSLAQSYHYLNQGVTHIPHVSDREKWEQTRMAMQELQFGEAGIRNVQNVLAAVLHLGNIVITADRKDHAKTVDPTPILAAAQLMQLDPTALDLAISVKTVKVAKESTLIPLSLYQAIQTRDSLAKVLYSSLFDWVVEKINRALQPSLPKLAGYLGVLDIFGFEVFDSNSLEQLFINYANEKLQNLFTQIVLKMEQEEYKSEGIAVPIVAFMDNLEVCELFDKKIGIFKLLDEELVHPGGSDRQLLHKFNSHFSSAPCFVTNKRRADAFSIKHFAGEVTYSVAGFLEKNRGGVTEDIVFLTKESTSVFIQTLFTRNKSKNASVAQTFVSSLSSLNRSLSLTSPHFIRCLKPNSLKQKDNFDSGVVLNQLQKTGLMQAIQIRSRGYDNRMPFRHFFVRYRCLLGVEEFTRREDWKGGCQAIKTFLVHKDASFEQGLQLGVTKVFWRSCAKLNELREQALQEAVLRLQRLVRSMQAKAVVRSRRDVKNKCEMAVKSGTSRELQSALDLAEQHDIDLPCVRQLKRKLELTGKSAKHCNNLVAVKKSMDFDTVMAVLSQARACNFEFPTPQLSRLIEEGESQLHMITLKQAVERLEEQLRGQITDYAALWGDVEQTRNEFALDLGEPRGMELRLVLDLATQQIAQEEERQLKELEERKMKDMIEKQRVKALKEAERKQTERLEMELKKKEEEDAVARMQKKIREHAEKRVREEAKMFQEQLEGKKRKDEDEREAKEEDERRQIENERMKAAVALHEKKKAEEEEEQRRMQEQLRLDAIREEEERRLREEKTRVSIKKPPPPPPLKNTPPVSVRLSFMSPLAEVDAKAERTQLQAQQHYGQHPFASLKCLRPLKGFNSSKAGYKKAMLQWQKEPLLRSLTVGPAGDKTVRPEARFLDLFKNIQGFMLDTYHSFPCSLGHEVVRVGHDESIFRDEIFAQIIKQTSFNSNPNSMLLGWKLLFFCLTSFQPTLPEMSKVLLEHIVSNCKKVYRPLDTITLGRSHSSWASMCLVALIVAGQPGHYFFLPTLTQFELACKFEGLASELFMQISALGVQASKFELAMKRSKPFSPGYVSTTALFPLVGSPMETPMLERASQSVSGMASFRGWVQKRGEQNKALKKRWCVLDGEVLSYFPSPTAQVPAGTINIYGAMVEKNNREMVVEGEKGKFFFYITPFDKTNLAPRTYVFCTDRAAEVDDWLNAFEDCGANVYRAIKEGYMEKTGFHSKHWRKRYFVLYEDRLVYYSSAAALVTKGSIMLSGDSCVTETAPGSGSSYKFASFDIFGFQGRLADHADERADRRFTLACANEADREEWLRCIRRVVESKIKNMFPDSVFEGILMHSNKEMRYWHQRYFVMRPGHAVFYRRKWDNEEAGKINLKDGAVLSVLPNREFTFVVSENEDFNAVRYFLSARKESEMKDWYKQFEDMIAACRSHRLAQVFEGSVTEGYLKVCKPGAWTFQARYCVLFNDRLSFFLQKTDPVNKFEWELPLPPGFEIAVEPDEDNADYMELKALDLRTVFSVSSSYDEGEKRCYLQCPETEMNSWIVILSALKRSSNRKKSPGTVHEGYGKIGKVQRYLALESQRLNVFKRRADENPEREIALVPGTEFFALDNLDPDHRRIKITERGDDSRRKTVIEFASTEVRDEWLRLIATLPFVSQTTRPSSIKEGWIKKKGLKNDRLRRRYFVLFPTSLSYFNRVKDEVVKGVIPLTVESTVTLGPESLCLVLHSVVGGREYQLWFIDKLSLAWWQLAIGDAIKALVKELLFGGFVEDHVAASPFRIPKVVHDTGEYLKAHGLALEGIFRVPGNNTKIQEGVALFEEEFKQRVVSMDSLVPSDADPHTVAGILKLYFRKLREPLVPFKMFNGFVAVDDGKVTSGLAQKYSALSILIHELPPVNRTLLAYLLHFLRLICDHAEENKMGATNCAMIFAPSLLRTSEDNNNTNSQYLIKQLTVAQNVIYYLIEGFESIFPAGKPAVKGPKQVTSADMAMASKILGRPLLNQIRIRGSTLLYARSNTLRVIDYPPCPDPQRCASSAQFRMRGSFCVKHHLSLFDLFPEDSGEGPTSEITIVHYKLPKLNFGFENIPAICGYLGHAFLDATRLKKLSVLQSQCVLGDFQTFVPLLSFLLTEMNNMCSCLRNPSTSMSSTLIAAAPPPASECLQCSCPNNMCPIFILRLLSGSPVILQAFSPLVSMPSDLLRALALKLLWRLFHISQVCATECHSFGHLKLQGGHQAEFRGGTAFWGDLFQDCGIKNSQSKLECLLQLLVDRTDISDEPVDLFASDVRNTMFVPWIIETLRGTRLEIRLSTLQNLCGMLQSKRSVVHPIFALILDPNRQEGILNLLSDLKLENHTKNSTSSDIEFYCLHYMRSLLGYPFKQWGEGCFAMNIRRTLSLIHSFGPSTGNSVRRVSLMRNLLLSLLLWVRDSYSAEIRNSPGSVVWMNLCQLSHIILLFIFSYGFIVLKGSETQWDHLPTPIELLHPERGSFLPPPLPEYGLQDDGRVKRGLPSDFLSRRPWKVGALEMGVRLHLSIKKDSNNQPELVFDDAELLVVLCETMRLACWHNYTKDATRDEDSEATIHSKVLKRAFQLYTLSTKLLEVMTTSGHRLASGSMPSPRTFQTLKQGLRPKPKMADDTERELPSPTNGDGSGHGRNGSRDSGNSGGGSDGSNSGKPEKPSKPNRESRRVSNLSFGDGITFDAEETKTVDPQEDLFTPAVPRARALDIDFFKSLPANFEEPRGSARPPPPPRTAKVNELVRALKGGEPNLKEMEELLDSIRPAAMKVAAQFRGVFGEKYGKKSIAYLKTLCNDPDDIYIEQAQQVLFEGRFPRAQGLALRQQEPCFVQLTSDSLRFSMGRNVTSQSIYKALGSKVVLRGPQRLHLVPLKDVKQLRLDIPFQFKAEEDDATEQDETWYSFLLVSGTKSIVLATHNKTQRDEWVQLISSATARTRLASRGQGDCLKGLYVRVPDRVGEGGSNLARYRDVLSQRIGTLVMADPAEVLRRLKDFAPIFAEDILCKNCDSPFTVFLRRHHCRKCGESFCHSCSNKRFVLQGKPVRVCLQCFEFLSEHAKDAVNDFDAVTNRESLEHKSYDSNSSLPASEKCLVRSLDSLQVRAVTDIELVFPLSVRQSVSKELASVQPIRKPLPARRLVDPDPFFEGGGLGRSLTRRLALSDNTRFLNNGH